MEENENMNIRKAGLDVITDVSSFIDSAMKVMEAEPDYDESYLVPFAPDEVDEETNVPIVKTRDGDYGNTISYVPSKYVLKRLNLAFNNKWSFFIVAEKREAAPLPRWSKRDDDWIDGSYYLKCLGCMIIPGFGVRMEYGVKKVFGDAESSDWKACKTDAFKKCAAAFGIYLDYDDEDDDSQSNSSGNRGSKGTKLDLDNLEYTDDDLDDAFECSIDFGKYGKDGSVTLRQIIEDEDDLKYVEWLASNANDDDVRFFASVLIKYYDEQSKEKNNKRKHKNSDKGKRNGNSSGGRSSGKGKHKDESDEETMEELLEFCRNELNNYERIQRRSLMASASMSNKYPKGKTKLELFTLNELRELAESLEA